MTENINDFIKNKYNDFIDKYNYDKDPMNNIYSIYDLTDFVQLNLEDNEKIPFYKYLAETISDGEKLVLNGSLHEINILNDEDTDEFLGNLVSFYHGDNSIESFYGLIYFDEYPNFYEKIDEIDQNSEIEIKGKLIIKQEEMYGEYYYLEIHEVEHLKLNGEDLI